jgi:hypothetical protein
MTTLASVPVSSVREALTVMREARELCLSASYHPSGGDTCRAYTPATHTVWIMGDPERIAQFHKQQEQK